MSKRSKAVVLHSGGLDSATVLAIAHDEGFDPYALTVSYGQRNIAEVSFAEKAAKSLGVTHSAVIEVDLTPIGGATPTRFAAAPSFRDEDVASGIFCLPARNTLLLSFALAWMQTLGARDVYAGFNPAYNDCPDLTAAYFTAYQKMAGLATTTGDGERVQLHNPLAGLSKAETIRIGLKLGVDYGVTHTCCRSGAEGKACRTCDACVTRAAGFAELDLPDPALIDHAR